MKTKMKTSLLLALPIAALVALSGCASAPVEAEPEEEASTTHEVNETLRAMLPADIRDAGVLNVGISPSFYPNAYFPAGSEELAGLDPTLLNSMGEKLGLKINFVTADFPSLVLGVESGKFDIAMSDISDTAVRQEQVTFVDYLVSYRMIYTTAENPKNVSGKRMSLCGLTTPVVTSTLSARTVEALSAECVAAGKAAIEVIPVTGHEAVRLAVDSGRADFGITASSEGATFDKESPGEYKHWLLEDEPGIPSGIATRKDATELQQALLATLQLLKEDGSYLDILGEHGLEDNALDPMGINLGK